MNFSLSQAMAASAWRRWCDTPVLFDMLEEVPRKLLISNLVKTGLIPLFGGAGYEFACNAHRISECVARYIYTGRISHEILNADYRDEDYNHHYFILDDEVWESFWDSVPTWCDVEDVKVREGIRFCLWTLLDLYRSPRTREVDDMLGLNEEESVQASKEDPYLIDSANGFFAAI
jgi:hypothetical protein